MSKSKRNNSDEAYVLDICDEILGMNAIRQYRKFSFLEGDPGKNGQRRRLPVDAFYADLGLAIEYREIQHFESTPHFDKPYKLTVSGVHRGEQRKKYDLLRDRLLPQNGIRLIVIPYHALVCDSRKRLKRERPTDILAVEFLLSRAAINLLR